MSPAGYWPELKAAVESGADAVYFGLNHFSARAKVGFTLDELPEVMKMLHGRQVKGFVTCNTLVFDHELAQAEEAIMAIAGSGVDAVIVQDVGICQLIRSIAPDLEIHGSTQMSVTSAEGAEFAKSLGCSRIVLGRELSLDEIRKISQSTDIELEVFVHGALCVSYSGQCFSSEAWGGRSANRGKCAQACRLSYDLIVDGRPRDLGPYRYLLSPGDLCTVDQIPDLIQAGIACVKIEGRYKDASYVALTTRAYRRAIDLAMKGIPNELNSDERRDLEQIYSRGLGAHFMSGTNHQKVVRGRAPRHRGVQMGVVCEVRKYSVVVRFDNLIRRGDGLVFDSADWKSPDEPEEGGNVYEVRQLGHGQLELEFGKGEIEFQQIRIGDLVWRTKDPSLQRGLKTILRSEKPVFTRPVSFQVFAEPGQPLQVEASTANGCRAQFVGDEPLQPAKKRGLELDTLNEKLGRLGGTPFHIQTVLWSPQKPVFVPASLLNMARRQLINDLMVQLEAVKRPVAQRRFDEIRTKLVQKSVESIRESSADLGVLHLLVRNPSQLDAALAVATNRPIGSITLDYLELKGLRLAVKKIKQQGQHPRVAAPRILKPGEENIVRALLSLD
ncbi:MAG: U32 family peptidase, partial [Planctomycetota bacterium]